MCTDICHYYGLRDDIGTGNLTQSDTNSLYFVKSNQNQYYILPNIMF